MIEYCTQANALLVLKQISNAKLATRENRAGERQQRNYRDQASAFAKMNDRTIECLQEL